MIRHYETSIHTFLFCLIKRDWHKFQNGDQHLFKGEFPPVAGPIQFWRPWTGLE